MGLFDRSKQITTTTTNLSSTTDASTTNIQDSGNVITSTTNDITNDIADSFNNSIEGFDTFVSQPIAVQAGGASGGSGFDMNSFFDSANSVAKAGTPGAGIGNAIKPIAILVGVGLLVWLALKFLRK